ncbi:hypothetical protein ACFV3E_37230 [Streptomyces sp. NPDC059718]
MHVPILPERGFRAGRVTQDGSDPAATGYPYAWRVRAWDSKVGLTPSGVSRAFGAKEVLAVGELTGRRPAAVEISDHNPNLFPGDDSRQRCTWGGSKKNPCTDDPKYPVTDKSGSKWACCDGHLPGYLRSRPGA